MSNDSSLHSLRDIEGVYGSFIVNANGELTARDLPALFDDHTLAESGERIVRLWEVLAEQGAPEYAFLEFAEYSLFLKGIPPDADLLSAGPTASSGCLCVVVPPSVNLLALRLASKWVARSVEREPPRLSGSA